MPEYLAPGVFVEEISSGVRPITGVSTSVTAFVGMTERGPVNTPVALNSMADFHRAFGGAPHPVFRLDLHQPRTGTSPLSTAGANDPPDMPEALFDVGSDTYALAQSTPAYALHSAVRSYFMNGGGRCYVASAGSYADPIDSQRLRDALDSLLTEDEPGLLVIPEVTRLPRAQAALVNQAALAHCTSHGARFAILDMPGGHQAQTDPRGDPLAAFRDDIGTDGLGNGAVYYPWLETGVVTSHDVGYANIDPKSRPLLQSLLDADSGAPAPEDITAPGLIGDFTIEAAPGQTVLLTPDDFHARDDSSDRDLRFTVLDDTRMTGALVRTRDGVPRTRFRQKALTKGNISFARDKNAADPGHFDLLVTDKDGQKSMRRTVFVVSGAKSSALSDVTKEIARQTTRQEAEIRRIDHALTAGSPLYAQIKQVMAHHMSILPPGAAMAGVYARTDNTRGVWKAPAGTSVTGVLRPAVTLSTRDQEGMTVSENGKSINAIRTFAGHGTLVWGARTLASSDPEWRYVPVRRTALMIERSVDLGTKWAVFEPNDANTWSSLKAAVDQFLQGLWRSGALAGATPSDAYFVKVGLGETMNAEDVQNGRLNLEIGFAPLRPAEFVIIRIQHRTQTARP